MQKGLLWAGGGLLGASIALWALQVYAARRNSCARYGGAPEGSASGTGPLTESLSWWPIGELCTWQRADGHGALASVFGFYPWSAATYAIGALAGAALVAGILVRRRAAGGGESPRIPAGSWRSIGPRR